MKKIVIYSVVFITSIFIENHLFAQTQTKEDLLTGNWTLDYEASIAGIQEASKVHFDKLDTERKNRLRQSFEGRQMDFNMDRTYVQRYPDGREVLGTWFLSDDSKITIMANGQGRQIDYTIKEVTGMALVLKPEARGPGRGLLTEWHFTKN